MFWAKWTYNWVLDRDCNDRWHWYKMFLWMRMCKILITKVDPYQTASLKQKHLFSITKATLQSPMSIHLSVNKTPKYPLSFILRRSFFVYNPSSFINFETFNFFSLFLNFEVCFACVKVSCVFISVPMSWGWWLLTVVACC